MAKPAHIKIAEIQQKSKLAVIYAIVSVNAPNFPSDVHPCDKRLTLYRDVIEVRMA